MIPRPALRHGFRFGLPGLLTLVALVGAFGTHRLAQADSVVSDCTNHVQLQAKLDLGGRITFQCAIPTIPIGATLVATVDATIDGGNTVVLDGLLTNRILIVASGALTLTNITLKNARVSGADNDGGAVRLASGSSLTTQNARFQNNGASGSGSEGGAIYAPVNTTVRMNDGWFRGNGAVYGGATFVDGSFAATGVEYLGNTADQTGGGHGTNESAEFANVVFRGNGATNPASYGGGAIIALKTLTITESQFYTNTSNWEGGAVWAVTTTVTGSTFVTNTATNGGGGAIWTSLAVVTGSTFVSNTAMAQSGGGIYATSAFVSDSTFQSNTASAGGGMYSVRASVRTSWIGSNTATDDGGGMFIPFATIIGSTFDGNAAADEGGGLRSNIAMISGASFLRNSANVGGGHWSTGATVTGSAFVSNTARNVGGGIWTGDVTIASSSFVSNSAAAGAGISASTSSIADSSFVRNTAEQFGGAMTVQEGKLSNTTLAHNRASVKGEAVFLLIIPNRKLELTNVTISQPSSASALDGGAPGAPLTVTASILAGSGVLCTNFTPIIYQRQNINQDLAGCAGTGDHENVDPKLGPVQDNGGSTWTMAPALDSPAVDRIIAPCPMSADQRGFARTAPCDIGAYETGFAPSIIAMSPTSATTLDLAFTLRITGTGFISGTVGLWNGSPRPTTVLNSTALSVSIPASDLMVGGTVPVQTRYGLAPDGTSNSLPFTISKRAQTITFGSLADKSLGDPPVVLSATATSNLPVTFAAGPAGVCTVASTTVSLLGPGTCTVTASQAGNAVYLAASSVDRAFTIRAAPTATPPSGGGGSTVFLGFAIKGYAGGW